MKTRNRLLLLLPISLLFLSGGFVLLPAQTPSREMKEKQQNKAIQKNDEQATPYRLGIALSGGGIKGISHAGALKALEEYGIEAQILSGVSAGAIVGALYSDGYRPEEIAAFFDDVTFSKMTNLQLLEGGFFSMRSFEKFLSGKLRASSFEELPLPLRVVATDLDKGCSVTFTSGALLPPVIASSSMPVLFAPKVIDGVNYVDGGVIKNFPVSTIRSDCRYVIGVNCSPMVADDYRLNIVNVATRAYHFMFRSNTLHDRDLCDLLIEFKDVADYDTFDVAKSKEIFEIGYRTTIEMLESPAGQDFLNRLKKEK